MDVKTKFSALSFRRAQLLNKRFDISLEIADFSG